ncbi:MULTISPECIES: hypothetical protein [unclassified Streptomyces]|uniref:hypothetical protein n=1 Tax=unclassified Streptomyces TaxID=2593676 RepID=UPI002F916736
MSEPERERIRDRAGHIREVLTGYRSGTSRLALPGEPRPEYMPGLPAETRYAAKIAELSIGLRTLKRWVADATPG